MGGALSHEDDTSAALEPEPVRHSGNPEISRWESSGPHLESEASRRTSLEQVRETAAEDRTTTDIVLADGVLRDSTTPREVEDRTSSRSIETKSEKEAEVTVEAEVTAPAEAGVTVEAVEAKVATPAKVTAPAEVTTPTVEGPAEVTTPLRPVNQLLTKETTLADKPPVERRYTAKQLLAHRLKTKNSGADSQDDSATSRRPPAVADGSCLSIVPAVLKLNQLSGGAAGMGLSAGKRRKGVAKNFQVGSHWSFLELHSPGSTGAVDDSKAARFSSLNVRAASVGQQMMGPRHMGVTTGPTKFSSFPADFSPIVTSTQYPSHYFPSSTVTGPRSTTMPRNSTTGFFPVGPASWSSSLIDLRMEPGVMSGLAANDPSQAAYFSGQVPFHRSEFDDLRRRKSDTLQPPRLVPPPPPLSSLDIGLSTAAAVGEPGYHWLPPSRSSDLGLRSPHPGADRSIQQQQDGEILFGRHFASFPAYPGLGTLVSFGGEATTTSTMPYIPRRALNPDEASFLMQLPWSQKFQQNALPPPPPEPASLVSTRPHRRYNRQRLSQTPPPQYAPSSGPVPWNCHMQQNQPSDSKKQLPFPATESPAAEPSTGGRTAPEIPCPTLARLYQRVKAEEASRRHQFVGGTMTPRRLDSRGPARWAGPHAQHDGTEQWRPNQAPFGQPLLQQRRSWPRQDLSTAHQLTAPFRGSAATRSGKSGRSTTRIETPVEEFGPKGPRDPFAIPRFPFTGSQE